MFKQTPSIHSEPSRKMQVLMVVLGAFLEWAAYAILRVERRVIEPRFIARYRRRVFVAVITSNFTKDRFMAMHGGLLSTEGVERGFTWRAFASYNCSFSAPGLTAIRECPCDARYGICCRVDAAFRYFLASPMLWMVRCIDDSWIHPENLLRYLERLELLLDPSRAIVVKAHLQRQLRRITPVSWIDGGSPILFSRAAVEHVLAFNFTDICSVPPGQDDTSVAVTLFHTFGRDEHWVDHRTLGGPHISRTRQRVMTELGEHLPTLFRDMRRPCTAARNDVEPVSYAWGIHTWGEKAMERFARSLDRFPRDLALEWTGWSYQFCRCGDAVAGQLESLRYLAARTPIVLLSEFPAEGRRVDRQLLADLAVGCAWRRPCPPYSRAGWFED